MIITENQLDEWVRGNARDAQGLVVELIWRLVAASSPRPKERRFPLGDSIGQPGPDGVLDTEFGFDPFVPEGRSFWAIGTGLNAGAKATLDYKELLEATPEIVRRQSAFIFVTPLSGRRDWQHTWKEDAQATWLEERRRRADWREVRLIDGTVLIDWLKHFPSVELWLAQKMSFPVESIDTPEQRWAILRTIGEPPPLPPDIFLGNREGACAKLKEVFSGTALQLQLDTHFPDQVVDFISAYVATMIEDSRVDTIGRCLVVSSAEAWNAIIALRECHIFVADFDLDAADPSGTRLLEKARRAGHAVIFGGRPGGIPHPNRVSIPSPKTYQVKEALRNAGYNEERARILAQKSDGNLSSLLRCLQNLSLMPEWVQRTDTAELAIAELLGAWDENSGPDVAVVEKLSKKVYGEWIGKMREIVLRPGTPLTQRDGIWKVIARYEGWYALGQALFDEHLDHLKNLSRDVLRERDPKFELPIHQRYAASIHGKVLTHSRFLRNGLAESLALLGSHPKALTSCSFGKAEATAALAVREILADADWVLWAGLNDLLPLLAEAAPGEFLDAVEKALNNDPCPFRTVFAQEGDGIMGGNYLAGLLWALETLAWDTNYLTRVIVILGGLTTIDPGGKWANRPANSLSAILLPWFPQTCASITKRQAAVRTLLEEFPNIAWKLLLTLLPSTHQVSSGTRKPAWREIIPDDWPGIVTPQEYLQQVTAYAELVIKAAKEELPKLAELIDRIDDLPPPARDQLFTHLRSDIVLSMAQEMRLHLWIELMDLVSKHRKFSDAEWALEPAVVNEIEVIAKRLAPERPIYRHQRLFRERDFDLYEERGSYEEQRNDLETRRKDAIDEVFAVGGLEDVLEFAKMVKSPWAVGVAFGIIALNDTEKRILPELLDSEAESLAHFAGGFICGKFRSHAWQWVDSINTAGWTPSQKGRFLACLPFTLDTWRRTAQLLQGDESPYWSKVSANPYNTEEGLELAIDHLIQHGRAYAAIRCIQSLHRDKRPVDSRQIVRALKAVPHSSESSHAMDIYAIVEVIKALQRDSSTNSDDLFQIEWAFLPLLTRHIGAIPKILERRLAEDPNFFSEVIRTVFRSTKEDTSVEKPTNSQKNIAKNAYTLLSEWKTPPGTDKDGNYSGEVLNAWLQKVRIMCLESGHLNVALSRIGHVLVYAPPDPDGLWLHHSAAEVLNAKGADEMRDGFRNELFNSRGVHSWTAGKEELEIATKKRDQAENLESRGYHRLAACLRELAISYERDSQRQALSDPFDD